VWYILRCAINDEIFNHVCSCETSKGLWEKLTLIYEETSGENLDSSRRNTFCNSNDENKITYLCLMANEWVENRDISDNDDDDDACDDEEKKRTKLNIIIRMRYMIFLTIALDASY